MSQKQSHRPSVAYQPLGHPASSSASSTRVVESRLSRNFVLALLMGMTFGFSFAYLLIAVINWDNYSLYFQSSNLLDDHHHHHDHDLDPHGHGALDYAAGPKGQVSLHDHDETFHKGEHFT